MKRNIMVLTSVLVWLILMPPVTFPAEQSDVTSELCTGIVKICEACYDGTTSVGVVQGYFMDVSNRVGLLMGEFCQVSADAKSKGWSKTFTNDYVSDLCSKTFPTEEREDGIKKGRILPINQSQHTIPAL